MPQRRRAAPAPDPSRQHTLFDVAELHLPPPPRRLFTALFAPPPACAAIDAARQRWPGLPRRLHPSLERLHVTLQFFNRVDALHERDWLASLQTLRFAPFDICLTQAALWQAPSGPIAVLLPERTPALAALHRATAQCARQAGLPAAAEGWQPHLTTLRRAEHTVLTPLAEPICWMVREVVLVWSDLQAPPPRYHPLGRFGA